MTPEQRFWHWFSKHEAKLFDFERDQEKIFNRASTEMQKVHPDLTFEFGPKTNEQASREFVISAAGIKTAFPAVVALRNAAPVLERWTITAFRPRRWPLNSVEFRGKCIDPKDVLFSLLNNGTIPGIFLYLPDYVEGDTAFGQIGYLLLDDALGEFDVETNVGLIKMLSTDAPLQHPRSPLKELQAQFDSLQVQLQRTSSRPS